MGLLLLSVGVNCFSSYSFLSFYQKCLSSFKFVLQDFHKHSCVYKSLLILKNTLIYHIFFTVVQLNIKWMTIIEHNLLQVSDSEKINYEIYTNRKSTTRKDKCIVSSILRNRSVKLESSRIRHFKGMSACSSVRVMLKESDQKFLCQTLFQ